MQTKKKHIKKPQKQLIKKYKYLKFAYCDQIVEQASLQVITTISSLNFVIMFITHIEGMAMSYLMHHFQMMNEY